MYMCTYICSGVDWSLSMCWWIDRPIIRIVCSTLIIIGPHFEMWLLYSLYYAPYNL